MVVNRKILEKAELLIMVAFKGVTAGHAPIKWPTCIHVYIYSCG